MLQTCQYRRHRIDGQGGRGSEAVTKSAEQHGDICPLGPVVAVELVNDEIGEGCSQLPVLSAGRVFAAQSR